MEQSKLGQSAGYAVPITGLADLKNKDYLGVISVDQHGSCFGMKAVILEMIKNRHGSIFNIGSFAGLRIARLMCSYSVVKFAIRELTQAAACQYKEHNIRVNTVHP